MQHRRGGAASRRLFVFGFSCSAAFNPAFIILHSAFMTVSILDYGMANLRSVQKGFEHVGVRAEVISRPEQIDRADKLVLPGVGAFRDAVATLRERGHDGAIKRHIERG